MNKIKRTIFGIVGLSGLYALLFVIFGWKTFSAMSALTIGLYVVLMIASLNWGFVALTGDAYEDLLQKLGLKYLGAAKRIIYGIIGLIGLGGIFGLVGMIIAANIIAQPTPIITIITFVLSIIAAINWGIIGITGDEDKDGLYYLRIR